MDGRAVDLRAKGRPLAVGTRVEVAPFTAPESQVPIAEPETPLLILARGPGWVVVDKPAGVPVHPLDPAEKGTVLNALISRYPEMNGIGEAGLRCGVVHRLDVDTSGVLLFATDEQRFASLRGAFRRHRVHKTYRALVQGHLEGEGDLVLHLSVARHSPARVRVVEEDAPEFGRKTRRTRLGWRALARLDAATLVEVQPVTGFLHQIRVSLAHLGHPVVGDAIYGGEGGDPARQMLHAAALRYGDIDVRSEDPPDFARTLERLGGARAAAETESA